MLISWRVKNISTEAKAHGKKNRTFDFLLLGFRRRNARKGVGDIQGMSLKDRAIPSRKTVWILERLQRKGTNMPFGSAFMT